MIKLNPKQVRRLLKKIKNPAERSIVKQYLQELSSNKADEISKKRYAKKALEIICRGGIEILKHVAIDALLDLFD